MSKRPVPGANTPQKTMAELLCDAAAGLSSVSQGKLDFYVDAVGIGGIQNVTQIRYNCFIRVISKTYNHFFFRVTSPSNSAFPATLEDTAGQSTVVNNKTELEAAIDRLLQDQTTKETIDYLYSLSI